MEFFGFDGTGGVDMGASVGYDGVLICSWAFLDATFWAWAVLSQWCKFGSAKDRWCGCNVW